MAALSAWPPTRRWRGEQEHNDEKLKRGIHISLNGVAAGLRNTG